MKKAIALTVALLLVLMLIPPTALGASEAELSLEDDITLKLNEAYDFLTGFAGFEESVITLIMRMKTDPEDTANIISGQAGLPDMIFERSLSFEMLFETEDYVDSHIYSISTRSELIDALCGCYTPSAAEAVYSVLAETLMTVRTKNGDNLYVRKDNGVRNCLSLYGYRIRALPVVNEIEVSGNTAIASVIYEICTASYADVRYLKVPISLEKVNGEWLIAENVFFTRIFSPDYENYLVEYGRFQSPIAPDLSGDTLSEAGVSWLVENTNELLTTVAGLSSISARQESDLFYYNFYKNYSDVVTPFADSDLPNYVKEKSFMRITSINLWKDSSVTYHFGMNGRDDLYGYLSEFLTDDALEDYVSVLTDRMRALYLTDEGVYVEVYFYRRTYLPVIAKVNGVKEIEYTEDGAVAEIELLSTASFELDPIYTTVSVKFRKTADGWRMAENIYGSKVYGGLVDEPPAEYSKPVPDLFPLPDLSLPLTREGAMMAAERAYQVAELFNYQTVHRIRIIGEMKNGRYGSDAYSDVDALLPNGLYADFPHEDEEYGKYGYYDLIVNKNRDVDFIGKRLTCLADVDALISEFATGRAKECLKLFYFGEPVFIDCDDGTLRTLSRERYVESRIPYLLDYGAFTVNGNTATLEVTMGIMYADSNEQGDLDFFIDPKPTTVTFQKTKDGWRISGGTMFELLYDGTFPGYGPLPSPETADATPMLWLISVISLAGMCAVIRKRKTR